MCFIIQFLLLTVNWQVFLLSFFCGNSVLDDSEVDGTAARTSGDLLTYFDLFESHSPYCCFIKFNIVCRVGIWGKRGEV